MITPLLLAALALVLTGPAPALLARSSWPYRIPRAAVALWQAIALAAVLAALGAGLALSYSTAGEPGEPRFDPSSARDLAAAAVLALTALVAVRLVWAVGRVAVGTRARRKRHRDLVDVLATPDGLIPGLRVLAEETPLAYCLPAMRGSRVVVSVGALDCLDDGELRAVLAHEQAHLRARHDLVLEAFTALHHAFPRWVRSDVALDQARTLVELLADDDARRRNGPLPLARALVALAGSSAPEAALAAAKSSTVLRVQRLADPEPNHPVMASATYTTAVLLLVVPTFTVATPILKAVANALT
ncbi:peptidase M48-like protein [Kribbella orskensis]|uniref:Peptidase M48-like protein n=1 Tax=Kribbella orskensis TaxID=2512216 RepID=A0ABY2BIW3_9ACTN|nr:MULTISPECIES: M56 family metallopeptidase [Kribbella]TCN37566.1 peptidase M48-like protein [Kribbella sp. VKM Ac-2500]TCO18932.1 peptidase M48-like protein [Kribbella orskensis]